MSKFKEIEQKLVTGDYVGRNEKKKALDELVELILESRQLAEWVMEDAARNKGSVNGKATQLLHQMEMMGIP